MIDNFPIPLTQIQKRLIHAININITIWHPSLLLVRLKLQRILPFIPKATISTYWSSFLLLPPVNLSIDHRLHDLSSIWVVHVVLLFGFDGCNDKEQQVATESQKCQRGDGCLENFRNAFRLVFTAILVGKMCVKFLLLVRNCVKWQSFRSVFCQNGTQNKALSIFLHEITLGCYIFIKAHNIPFDIQKCVQW